MPAHASENNALRMVWEWTTSHVNVRKYVRFQVLTVASMKMSRKVRTACIIRAVHTSETSVYLNETTRRYIPEGCHLHKKCSSFAIFCVLTAIWYLALPTSLHIWSGALPCEIFLFIIISSPCQSALAAPPPCVSCILLPPWLIELCTRSHCILNWPCRREKLLVAELKKYSEVGCCRNKDWMLEHVH
jgi:hypothetical protein